MSNDNYRYDDEADYKHINDYLWGCFCGTVAATLAWALVFLWYLSK